MATKAQEWASKRNSTKWRLMGNIAALTNISNSNSILTGTEVYLIEDALVSLKALVKSWKTGSRISKERYLKAAK